MPFWPFLNQWWNLPFLIELGLVGAFFALQTLGLGEQGGHDQDLTHEVTHECEHDLEGDCDAAETSDAEPGADGAADLSRVPFMVVWLTLLITSGFSGIFINRVLYVRWQGSYPFWGFPVALAASVGLGLAAVRFAARQIGKLVDTGGRGSARKRELPGSVGVVASPRADSHFGEVRVRGPRGEEMLVHACVAEGEQALTQGDKVVLLDYQEASGLFRIARLHD